MRTLVIDWRNDATWRVYGSAVPWFVHDGPSSLYDRWYWRCSSRMGAFVRRLHTDGRGETFRHYSTHFNSFTKLEILYLFHIVMKKYRLEATATPTDANRFHSYNQKIWFCVHLLVHTRYYSSSREAAVINQACILTRQSPSLQITDKNR